MFDRTVEANAGIVRLQARWRQIAADAPPASPADPTDPSYDFSELDAAVIAANQRGLDVLMMIFDAPEWAEGPDRPVVFVRPGTWKPDPTKLGDFARALAQRYSGGFAGLPRVRRFQIWNEPNLDHYLSPQYEGKKLVSPQHYTRMLNAAYAGIKSVSPDNFVVTGGTAPYGDPPGGHRSRPLQFWRKALCLKGRRKLEGKRCKPEPNFDALAHHPINLGAGGPTGSAIHPDDASIADLGNVGKVLHAAERERTLGTGGNHPLWATEFWWQSDPTGRRPRRTAPQACALVSGVAVPDLAPGRERGDDPPGCRFHPPLEHGPLLRRRHPEAGTAGVSVSVRARPAQARTGDRLGEGAGLGQAHDRAPSRRWLEQGSAPSKQKTAGCSSSSSSWTGGRGYGRGSAGRRASSRGLDGHRVRRYDRLNEVGEQFGYRQTSCMERVMFDWMSVNRSGDAPGDSPRPQRDHWQDGRLGLERKRVAATAESRRRRARLLGPEPASSPERHARCRRGTYLRHRPGAGGALPAPVSGHRQQQRVRGGARRRVDRRCRDRDAGVYPREPGLEARFGPESTYSSRSRSPPRAARLGSSCSLPGSTIGC